GTMYLPSFSSRIRRLKSRTKAIIVATFRSPLPSRNSANDSRGGIGKLVGGGWWVVSGEVEESFEVPPESSVSFSRDLPLSPSPLGCSCRAARRLAILSPHSSRRLGRNPPSCLRRSSRYLISTEFSGGR